jgi:hypothetical protein
MAIEAHQQLLEVDATIPVAFGTDVNFAQLNRERPSIPEKALVCYSIHPQMHAHDKLSLCETLEGQPATVDSAYEFFERDVVISPITLKPRFNPAGVLSVNNLDGAEPPTDERQSTEFAAAWTVGTLAQLATHPHVASVTFYETHGRRGVMDSLGTPYMMHSVFRKLRDYHRICKATSSDPSNVMGLALIRDDGCRGMIVGNMSRHPRTIILDGAQGIAFRIHTEPEAVTFLGDCEIG